MRCERMTYGGWLLCILEDWCRTAWKGDDWLNPVCAGQNQYAGIKGDARAVYSHSRNCSCCCPAKFLSGIITMFHSFMVYNVIILFCCDIILEVSYIQRY